MAERRILDVAQLKSAVQGAAKPLCDSEPIPGTSSEFVIYHRTTGGSLVELFDSRLLNELSIELDNVVSAQRSMDPESLPSLFADVTIVIGSHLRPRDIPAESAEVHSEIVTEVAAACVGCLARSRRHYLPAAKLMRAHLAQAIQAHERERLIGIFRDWLGLATYGQLDDSRGVRLVPRAFIAPPLTHLSDSDHAMVLDQARRVRRILNKAGMVVVAPSPYLTPSSSSDEPAYELYRLERILISGSDLVVAVGAEHDSWGLSRTIAWAEAANSVTIVLSSTEFLSRVLDSTSHRTYRLDVEDDLVRQMAKFRGHLLKCAPLIRLHARDRTTTARRLHRVLEHARKRLATLDAAVYQQSLLTEERAIELVSDPVMLDQASHSEGRALRRLLGPGMDAILAAAHDAKSSSESGKEQLRSAIVLSPQSFANLRSIARAQGWTEQVQLSLISAYMKDRVKVGRAYRNSTVSGSDWIALYERTFGGGSH